MLVGIYGIVTKFQILWLKIYCFVILFQAKQHSFIQRVLKQPVMNSIKIDTVIALNKIQTIPLLLKCSRARVEIVTYFHSNPQNALNL